MSRKQKKIIVYAHWAGMAAPNFRIDQNEGKSIISEMKSIIRQWSEIADSYDISEREKREMRSAFCVRT